MLNKPGQQKKSDSDNKAIIDFMKNNDKKKLTPSSHDKLIEVGSKEPKINIVNINSNIVNNPKNEVGENSLKELMKKCRQDLKTKPKEDVVWIGKEKDEKPEKIEYKFPKVVILEKERPKEEININKSTPTTNNPTQDKEIYDLNRYCNELDKIDNEDEENEIETQPEEKLTVDEVRDYIEIEDINLDGKQPSNQNIVEYESDNSQIEELRIELENTLGFDMFKKIYKIVDERV